MFPIKKLEENYPQYKEFNIGDLIGYGVDGCVFDYYNNVIKFCIIDNSNITLPEANVIKSNMDYVIWNNPNVFARVYTCEFLYSNIDLYIYYYVMEKLNHISEDESKVFRSLLSHEDRNCKKDYSLNQIQSMLDGMKLGLDFDYDKVFSFCKNVMNSNVKQHDIHERNIMKDNFGNFKFIDFERIEVKK